MPNAARLFEHAPDNTPAPGSTWSGELHGEIGAMHRSIEQRLLSGSFAMTVVPMPVRPVEALVARVSRAAGWLALTSAGLGVGTALTLLR